MNPRAFASRPASRPKRSGPWPAAGLLAALSIFGFMGLRAQDPPPEPTPVSSPAPEPTPGDTPAPSPTPVGGDPTAAVTVTPGLPSAATLEAYNVARTPQVTVVLGSNTQPVTSTTSSLNPTPTTPAATAPAPLSAQGGVCSLVRLPVPSSRAAAKTSRRNASASGQPTTATVTLAYNSGYAGQLVWVQPLDGGTLSADAGTGTPYTTTEGFFLTLAADGTAAFSYQPPASSGTYQVLTRFDNVVTALPFLVPDAN